MDRNKFLKVCCYTMIGAPTVSSLLQSCSTLHFASFSKNKNKLRVSKSEFIIEGKKKIKTRDFVFIKPEDSDFPICLYKTDEDKFTASLLRCTHRGCELNVGGGIYSCPCHGSEFSITGDVLEGPANQNLKLYRTESDHENIYVYL